MSGRILIPDIHEGKKVALFLEKQGYQCSAGHRDDRPVRDMNSTLDAFFVYRNGLYLAYVLVEQHIVSILDVKPENALVAGVMGELLEKEFQRSVKMHINPRR